MAEKKNAAPRASGPERPRPSMPAAASCEEARSRARQWHPSPPPRSARRSRAAAVDRCADGARRPRTSGTRARRAATVGWRACERRGGP
eukprot:6104446-Prymnesium_polylepis.1